MEGEQDAEDPGDREVPTAGFHGLEGYRAEPMAFVVLRSRSAFASETEGIETRLDVVPLLGAEGLSGAREEGRLLLPDVVLQDLHEEQAVAVELVEVPGADGLLNLARSASELLVLVDQDADQGGPMPAETTLHGGEDCLVLGVEVRQETVPDELEIVPQGRQRRSIEAPRVDHAIQPRLEGGEALTEGEVVLVKPV